MANNKKYFFGDTEVSKEEKVKKVNKVFDSVAKRYDIMNDILS
ncbi:MAG: class I SAM-dependent methyltransferase, partial [Pseudomonadota bacterium]|nr:class I SAM-dependent methyltransferase [Pseudomonadota bacterium]